MKQFKVDVLVVGGGGAGLRAALEAREGGVDVALVSKTPLGLGSCTAYSGAGFTAAVNDFSVDQHFDYTMKSGRHINSRELVSVLVRESSRRILELKDLGVKVYASGRGYHCLGSPPVWGLEITKPLASAVRKSGVRIWEGVVIVDLLVEEGFVVGALGFDFRSGDFIVFEARSVVLATGGAGAMYLRSDNPIHTMGDGYAMASRLLVELQDMEFVQFYPLGANEPGLPKWILPPFLADAGRMVNAEGEDIVEKYAVTEKPVAVRARDLLSRAIFLEVSDGRGVDDSVLLDLTQIGLEREEEIAGRDPIFATMRAALLRRFRIKERPVRITPVCHHFMGGIRINARCETNVKGLYAAGEVTGGVHGANRLGGNALSDVMVFGARAGYYAAVNCSSTGQPGLDVEVAEDGKARLVALLSDRPSRRTIDPGAVRRMVQETMWRKAGIVRIRESLEEALQELRRIREDLLPKIKTGGAGEFMEAIEVMNGLTVGEVVVRSALCRTESRGSHYRADYPSQDDRQWRKNVIMKGRRVSDLRSIN